MEVIVDELQKNGIRIDMTLLNIHVNRILDIYKAMYDEATSRLKADQLVVFHENCFNTVARVMGYLTLVRCMNLPKEEDVRKAVRLVVSSTSLCLLPHFHAARQAHAPCVDLTL